MRIIDANINRAVEGIRVIEDILRFEYNEKKISKKLRNIRHNIRKKFDKEDILFYRDSSGDVGKTTSFNTTIDLKSSYKDIINANFSRITEALRVLEEMLKNNENYEIGKDFERLRFKVYDLELEVNKRMKMDFNKEIYGITNESLTNNTHIESVKLLLENGIKIIQYREKNKSRKEKLSDCIAIKKIVDKYEDVLFIVNDDVDIAHIVKADGVHLGQDDLDLELVKKNYPSLIVGVSTHNKEQVKKAIENKADYIGVGPIFNTTTKKNVEGSDGLDFLKWVSENVNIPHVSIGGISDKNIESVFENGGQVVAMISQLFSDEKIKNVISKFK